MPDNSEISKQPGTWLGIFESLGGLLVLGDRESWSCRWPKMALFGMSNEEKVRIRSSRPVMSHWIPGSITADVLGAATSNRGHACRRTRFCAAPSRGSVGLKDNNIPVCVSLQSFGAAVCFANMPSFDKVKVCAVERRRKLERQHGCTSEYLRCRKDSATRHRALWIDCSHGFSFVY